MGRSVGSSARKRPQDDKAKQSDGGTKKSKLETSTVTNGEALSRKKSKQQQPAVDLSILWMAAVLFAFVQLSL